MDVHHPGASPDRRVNCLRNGVWNVMKLEIEKDALAPVGEGANEGGAFAREEPAANLEPAGDAVQVGCERQGSRRIFNVQSD
jgi:hypothetical protein